MNVKAKQALRQVPALVAAACLLALAVNQWRADKLALVGDWSAEARFADAAGDSPLISLEAANRLFREGKALFLDARPASQYAGGHIHGALNFPAQELDRHFMQLSGRLEGAETIIAYCDGESCDLSHTLALFLHEMGFANVHILVNGWSAWQQAGLPVQAGG
jgi:rhodanese-related sulfurtransferase